MTLSKAEANTLSKFIGLVALTPSHLPPDLRRAIVEAMDEFTNAVAAARLVSE